MFQTNANKPKNKSIKEFFAVKTINSTTNVSTSSAAGSNPQPRAAVGLVRKPNDPPPNAASKAQSWMSQSQSAFDEEYDDLDDFFDDEADEAFFNDATSLILKRPKSSSMYSTQSMEHSKPSTTASMVAPPSSMPPLNLSRKRILPWDPPSKSKADRREQVIAGIDLASKVRILHHPKRRAIYNNPMGPLPDGDKTVIEPKTKINLSQEQQGVLDLVMAGNSIFFTGAAGTGKSVLLRAIIKGLRKKHKLEEVGVTASTGLAALNIGGETLHRFAGIGLGNAESKDLISRVARRQDTSTRWKGCKALIIDEISMVDGELLDKLNDIAMAIRKNREPFGGIQLICTGDFFQLPPVDGKSKFNQNEPKVCFAFESQIWKKKLNTTIVLTQVFRQQGDNRLIEILNNMRMGTLSPQMCKELSALSREVKYDDGIEPTELYPTRKEVDMANKRRLESLRGILHLYASKDTVNNKILKDMGMKEEDGLKMLENVLGQKQVLLRHDCQVMLIRNLTDSLVNGSLGLVIAFLTAEEYSSALASTNGYGKEFDETCREIEANRQVETNGYKPETLGSIGIVNHDVASFKSGDMGNPMSGYMRMSAGTGTGLLFPIVRFTSDIVPQLVEPVTFEVGNRERQVIAERTQLPLILSWAMSVHKSQGQTLERVKVNLYRTFEAGQAYVAVSRATAAERLQVINFTPAKVIASPKVIEFYKALKTVADMANGAGKRMASGKASSRPASKAGSRTASSGWGYEEIDLTKVEDDGFA